MLNNAYLINSTTRTVTPILVGDFRDLQKKVGCDLFTVADTLANEDVLYVDDEGLINGTKTSFVWRGQLLMGNGVLLCSDPDTGDSADVKTSLNSISRMVTFPAPSFELSDEERDERCKMTVIALR